MRISITLSRSRFRPIFFKKKSWQKIYNMVIQYCTFVLQTSHNIGRKNMKKEKKNSSPKIHISLRVPEEILIQIGSIARANGSDLSPLLVECLAGYAPLLQIKYRGADDSVLQQIQKNSTIRSLIAGYQLCKTYDSSDQ